MKAFRRPAGFLSAIAVGMMNRRSAINMRSISHTSVIRIVILIYPATNDSFYVVGFAGYGFSCVELCRGGRRFSDDTSLHDTPDNWGRDDEHQFLAVYVEICEFFHAGYAPFSNDQVILLHRLY